MLIDVAKMYSMMIILAVVFVTHNIYVIPWLFKGVLKDMSILLLYGPYAVITSYVAWHMWKPTNEIHELAESVPVEYIDFKYIALRRNRVLIFSTLTSVMYLLPVFYINGLIGRVAFMINQHITRNKAFADSLSWCLSAVVTGIIGNIATLCLYKFVGIIIRKRHKGGSLEQPTKSFKGTAR